MTQASDSSSGNHRLLPSSTVNQLRERQIDLPNHYQFVGPFQCYQTQVSSYREAAFRVSGPPISPVRVALRYARFGQTRKVWRDIFLERSWIILSCILGIQPFLTGKITSVGKLSICFQCSVL